MHGFYLQCWHPIYCIHWWNECSRVIFKTMKMMRTYDKSKVSRKSIFVMTKGSFFFASLIEKQTILSFQIRILKKNNYIIRIFMDSQTLMSSFLQCTLVYACSLNDTMMIFQRTRNIIRNYGILSRESRVIRSKTPRRKQNVRPSINTLRLFDIFLQIQ